MMNLVAAPVSETFSVVGTCIDCTAPASLLATMTVIAIGVALALRSVQQGVKAKYSQSIGIIGLVFDKFLVDPAPAVVPAPHLAPQQPTGDRASWHNHRPEMPGVRPRSLGIK